MLIILGRFWKAAFPPLPAVGGGTVSTVQVRPALSCTHLSLLPKPHHLSTNCWKASLLAAAPWLPSRNRNSSNCLPTSLAPSECYCCFCIRSFAHGGYSCFKCSQLRREDFVQDPHMQPQNPGPMSASGRAQLTSSEGAAHTYYTISHCFIHLSPRQVLTIKEL